MLTKDFYFDLPPELIAQTPARQRGEDRLLVMDRKTGAYEDAMMEDFPDFIESGSLLVVNNSKVRKARVYGESETGGTVEFLFLEEHIDHTWKVMATKLKKQRKGKHYQFKSADGSACYHAVISEENPDDTRTLCFDEPLDESFFEKLGHVPLPPYIKREDDFSDEKRYQTVYAKEEGSVAAPTAGLHFTDEILARVKAKGCTITEVTLHVGPGTFLPVRTENLEDHKMHWERYEVSQQTSDLIAQAKAEGRKVVATGTTSVRTLESAYNPETGRVDVGWNRTNLFIKPGFTYHVVDQLLTNFHTPESTLLALVSAFSTKEHIFRAYQHAIDERYHFFSYGDAMFIK